MNPVELPVAPGVAQPAAKAASRSAAQGGDAAPADGTEGGFAALMQQLAAPASEGPGQVPSKPSPEVADALAQDTPLASAAPAEADPALLALAMAMASQAAPQEAPPPPGVSLRGAATAPDTDAESTGAALDTRTLPQGAARVAGRAGQAAALERDAVFPRDVPSSPPAPAVLAPALIAEAARSHSDSKGVEAASLDLPAPTPLHLAAPPAPAAAAPALLEATLQARPGEPRFASELATQLQVMVDGEIEHARLQLHPAELGPIHITMTVQAHTADIQFHAAHANTRQGLQDGLDDLRRLLGEMGLQLGQASVGAGQQQQHEPGSPAPGATRSTHTALAGGGSVGSDALRPGRTVRETLGLLDLYA